MHVARAIWRAAGRAAVNSARVARRTLDVSNEIEFVVDVSVLRVGQDQHHPGDAPSAGGRVDPARRKGPLGLFVTKGGQAQLLQVVEALRPPPRLAGRIAPPAAAAR